MRKLLLSLGIFTALSCSALNQPTIGNIDSNVHVIAFLEPKCPDSKKYYIETYPKLKSEFIDQNKISYTVITTSFLYKSKIFALALICLYHENEKYFFDFLDYIYKNQSNEKSNWATKEKALEFARNANPNIDINKLKACIEHEDFDGQVEENTDLGNLFLGHLSTPTLIVNGTRIENKEATPTWPDLKEAILQAIQKQ
jgi:protein-disulfide isomerase